MATQQELMRLLERSARRSEVTADAYDEVLTSEGEIDVTLSDGTVTPNLNKRIKAYGSQVTSVVGKKGDVTIGDISEKLELGSAAKYNAADLPITQKQRDEFVGSVVGKKGDVTITDISESLELGSASKYNVADLPISAAQKPFNDRAVLSVESIADLIAIKNPKVGQVFSLKSYHAGLNKGGSNLVCVRSSNLLENGVTCFRSNVVGFEDFYFVRTDATNVTVEMGGVKADGSDESVVIQGIVRSLYPSTIARYTTGSGVELNFNANSVYKINSEILLPPYVRLNGNGCQLVGNNKINDCFVSAEWVNGVLTKTAGTTIGAGNYYSWSSIERFKFKEFKKNVYIYGWTHQCFLQKLESYRSIQHIVSAENYFLTVKNCNSDWTGRESGLPNYQFGVFSGMLVLENLAASSCDIGYSFVAGLQAVTLNKLDAESVKTAIKLNGSGQTGGILITGGYFEGVSDTIVDATGIGSANSTIDMVNCFINSPEATVCNTTGGDAAFIADKRKNYVQNHKVWLKELSAASFSNTNGNMALVAHGEVAPNSPRGATYDTNEYLENNPEAWCKNIHTQTITSYRAASGKTQAIHNHFFGVIPSNYYGSQGVPESNVVPFCTHVSTVTETGKLNIVITTSIAYRDFVQGVFNLHITSDTMNGVIANGRFYRDTIHFDNNTHSLVGTVSNVDGVIVIKLSGLAGAVYQCKGFIKLI